MMTQPLHAPLAELLRPRHLDQVLGQRHLLGPGQPLRCAAEAGRLHSMILWGPPGIGKTTLAPLLAQSVDGAFIALPAVLSTMDDVHAAVAQAVQRQADGLRSVLFIDEIHRLDKRRQALLLSALSASTILIGATTENPSFTLNPPLMARMRVHVLHELNEDNLSQLLQRAAAQAMSHLWFDHAALTLLAAWADGDARRCLNLLQQAGNAADVAGISVVDIAFVTATLNLNSRRFDKGGEQFYNQISALHKSVRGSHPDAALYWMCRMLDSGTDASYLLRRLTAMGWDDIGLADPRAMRMVELAADSWQRERTAEAHLALAQLVVYLSVAAKSNAGAMAFIQMKQYVRHGGLPPST